MPAEAVDIVLLGHAKDAAVAQFVAELGFADVEAEQLVSVSHEVHLRVHSDVLAELVNDPCVVCDNFVVLVNSRLE